MNSGIDISTESGSRALAKLWKQGLSAIRSRDLSVVTFGVFLRTVAAFAFAKLTAAFLGPVAYATYGHFYMVATYLVTASSLGLANAFTVYIARDNKIEEEADSRARAVTALGAAGGGLTGVALLGLFFVDRHGALLPYIRGWSLSWWFVFCMIVAVGSAIQSVLLGKQQHARYQMVMALNPLVSCVALVVAVAFGPISPTIAILTYMLGFAVPLVAFPSMIASVASVQRGAMASVIRFSIPYLVPSLLIPTVATFSILSVRYVIASHVSTYNLGLWQALWRISEGYMGALISVGTALFLPRFSRVATQSEAWKSLAQSAIMLTGLYLPLAICFIAFPRFVLTLLLSAQFSPLASLMPVQICGDVLKILCFLLELFFTSILAPKTALLGEFVFSGAFLALSLMIVSNLHSPLGAVWSYTLSYALVVCMLLPLAWRHIRTLPLVRPADGNAL
ncbi:MAG TPA: hypothetical protein VKR52_17530 [Terracidiphilus sp.]|nr:hypothetical protein [Terracidiphilus sp.]